MEKIIISKVNPNRTIFRIGGDIVATAWSKDGKTWECNRLISGQVTSHSGSKTVIMHYCRCASLATG